MKLFNKKTAGISLIVVLALSISLVSFNRDDKLFEINKNLDIFYSLIRELNLFYVDSLDVSDLMEKGVDEMLLTLDPYTTFIPESEVDDFIFMTTGEYAGVGALISKQDDKIIIAEPYEGFPADKAGLKAGDVMIEVGGKSTEGMEIEDVSNLLKGASNEIVKVKVMRYGEKKAKTFDVLREQIQIDAVPYYGMLNDKTGYIRLSSFTANCGDEIRKLVRELRDNKGAESLVLDLRGNPGGLLNEAVRTLSTFVPEGTKVVYTKGKVSQWDKEYFTTREPVDTTMNLAILVNRGSASASEIVSGALQDLDRAIVIGTRTFGKGLVQTTRDLSYNAKLKVTTAKYYVPSDRCIQALDYSHRNEDGSVGVVPDSLISEFTTKGGRIVYDGGGITPDVKIKTPLASSLTYNLVRDYITYDYATKFYYEHESILPADEFEITNDIYDDFIEFVKSNDFSYESETEKSLDELEKIAKAEKYYSRAEEQFAALRKEVSHELDKDLHEFQDEIKEILKSEIVSRYYYQTGSIQASIKDDESIDKAIDIVNDQATLDKLFAPGTIIEKEK